MRLIFILFLYFITINNIHGQDFYGSTTYGGQYGGGAIFKTDSSGNNYSVLHNFKIENPGHPKGLTKTSSGRIFGICEAGPLRGGILYEVDELNNTTIIRHVFDTAQSILSYQLGIGPDGNLYGMTQSKIFCFDITTNTGQFVCNSPYQVNGYNLYTASNNMMYGVINEGGANGYGGILKFDPILKQVLMAYDFQQENGYTEPYLLLASNNLFYGISSRGGSDLKGCIFSYDPITNTVINLSKFSSPNYGYPSYGSLVEGANKTLYGIWIDVYNQAFYNKLFAYSITNNSLTTLYTFDHTLNLHGSSLIFGSDNKLYGVESNHETDYSRLFVYMLDGTLKNKLTFDTLNCNYPIYNPIEQNGSIYLCTVDGGTGNSGGLIKYNIAAKSGKKLFDFNYCPQGASSDTKLIVRDEKIYGTTEQGGEFASGTIYQYDIFTNIYKSLYDIPANHSCSNLMMDHKGIIYAIIIKQHYTTQKSYIISLDPITNQLLTLFTTDKYTGKNLNLASDGHLYFTESNTTTTNLVDFNPTTRTATTRYVFNYENAVTGKLLLSPDGSFYGVTRGHQNELPYIFKFHTINYSFAKLAEFTSGFGTPMYGITKGKNGKYYGSSFVYTGNTTKAYEFDPSNNSIILKASISNVNNPVGELQLSENGNFYNGFFNTNNNSGYGGVVEYNTQTSTFIIKKSFGFASGFRILSGLTSYKPKNIISHVPPLTKYCERSSVSLFTPNISGTTYQWYKDGSALPGKTFPYIEIKNLVQNDEGYYYCKLSSLSSINFTDTFYLDVLASPNTQAFTTNDEICNGGSIMLSSTGGINPIWDQGATPNILFTPSMSTTYTVRAFNIGNCYSDDTVKINVLSKLQVPQNRRTTEIRDTMAIARWDSVPSANYYRIRLRLKGTTSWILYRNTTNNRLKFNNLSPGLEYEWSVRAFIDSMCFSNFSITNSFKTLDDCVSPKNLSVIQIQPDEATFSWWKPAPTSIGYQVFFRKESQTWANKVTYYSALQSINLSQLDTGIYYYWGVRSFCDSDTSYKSEWSYGAKFRLSGSFKATRTKLLDQESIIVGPNPANNSLIIEPIQNSEFNGRILDLQGRVVYEIENPLNSSNITVDLTTIPNGIYFLKGQCDGNSFSKMISIMH